MHDLNNPVTAVSVSVFTSHMPSISSDCAQTTLDVADLAFIVVPSTSKRLMLFKQVLKLWKGTANTVHPRIDWTCVVKKPLTSWIRLYRAVPAERTSPMN